MNKISVGNFDKNTVEITIMANIPPKITKITKMSKKKKKKTF